MRGLAILSFFNFVGVLLREWARIPLPGSVLGAMSLSRLRLQGYNFIVQQKEHPWRKTKNRMIWNRRSARAG